MYMQQFRDFPTLLRHLYIWGATYFISGMKFWIVSGFVLCWTLEGTGWRGGRGGGGVGGGGEGGEYGGGDASTRRSKEINPKI